MSGQQAPETAYEESDDSVSVLSVPERSNNDNDNSLLEFDDGRQNYYLKVRCESYNTFLACAAGSLHRVSCRSGSRCPRKGLTCLGRQTGFLTTPVVTCKNFPDTLHLHEHLFTIAGFWHNIFTCFVA